jgi:hypothetical protein
MSLKLTLNLIQISFNNGHDVEKRKQVMMRERLIHRGKGHLEKVEARMNLIEMKGINFGLVL